ncbi:MAG: HAD family hydrolase [Prevotella sp.]|nr:HAD family hydrolase [Prevotella sp.]
MKDYDTYIFDLDGTLLDTLGDLTASVNHTMAIFGLPQHTQEEVRRMVGNGIGKLIERAIPAGKDNQQFASILSTFTAHYLAHSMDRTRPYDGITTLLSALHRQGKRLAIVSNKQQAATTKLCRHFFKETISVAIGESGNVRRKPAPDTVDEALRQLGAGKDGAVYIGDSEVDIATARAAGLSCISVLWGFRDRQFLIQHGATCFVSRPEEILAGN